MIGQAIVFSDVDTPEVQQFHLPELASGEVLVETAYSCVSPGTELRCLAGKQPGVSFPCVPGYSLSGIIAAVGADVALEIGTPVYCAGTAQADVPLAWGGHVSHAIQSAENVFPIPAGVDLLDASITHIAAISYHGMRLSRPMAHETVVVIGLGIIGQFAARLHALSGADVLGIDLAEDRVQQIRDAGIEAVSSLDEARSLLPNGADVIVDATGANAVFADAIEFAREISWDDSLEPRSRYLVQGSYAEDFCVPYQAAFSKELSFWLPRDSQPRDFRSILDFMGRGKLPVRDMISEVASPADAPNIYRALQNRELLTAAFQWQV